MQPIGRARQTGARTHTTPTLESKDRLAANHMSRTDRNFGPGREWIHAFIDRNCACPLPPPAR